MRLFSRFIFFVLIPTFATALAMANTLSEYHQPTQEDAQGEVGPNGENKEWKNWPTVGQASLNWLFFNVYQSELKSPTGRYIQSTDITPHPLALSIIYQRDITKKQLLKATGEQWGHLGYDSYLQAQWLEALDNIFTDVQEKDQLVYITDGRRGEFHFYGKNHTSLQLGQIDDEALNDAFLAIWLSENTGYPSHRANLIGIK